MIKLILFTEPEYEQALNNLGNLYRSQGQLVAAKALLEKAVRHARVQHCLLQHASRAAL
jgi:Tetratricopeptide repeat